MKQKFCCEPTPTSLNPELLPELMFMPGLLPAERNISVLLRCCPIFHMPSPSACRRQFHIRTIGGIDRSSGLHSARWSDTHCHRWTNPSFVPTELRRHDDCHGSASEPPSSCPDYVLLFLLSHPLETVAGPKGASSLDTLRQAAESLAQQVAVLAPLVVGRETGGVRRLCDLALEDLLEGVGALARGRVDVAHQMHFEFCVD